MGKKKKEELGRLFGRPDIERCDLFMDCGFLDWDEYTGTPIVLNESSKKGLQMYSSVPSGGHKKCGLQGLSGYFDKRFKSIFVDDPYVEKWKMMGRPPAHPQKGAWRPSGPAKQHSTPGDHYGTFTRASEMLAFSPLTKAVKVPKREFVNFLTNPGKKGGSGYPDICINKYPPHTVNGRVDSYVRPAMLYSKKWKSHKSKIRGGPFRAGFASRPYFEDNPYKPLTDGPTYVRPREKAHGSSRGVFYPPSAPKEIGRVPEGCFSKFTEWQHEPYRTQKDVEKELKDEFQETLVFRPEPRLKTYYTISVVNNKVDVSCNERTWRTMKPITYPQFNL